MSPILTYSFAAFNMMSRLPFFVTFAPSIAEIYLKKASRSVLGRSKMLILIARPVATVRLQLDWAIRRQYLAAPEALSEYGDWPNGFM